VNLNKEDRELLQQVLFSSSMVFIEQGKIELGTAIYNLFDTISNTIEISYIEGFNSCLNTLLAEKGYINKEMYDNCWIDDKRVEWMKEADPKR